MGARMEWSKVSPGARDAMMGLEHLVQRSSLERSLVNLVRVRASQINGCAYCLDMHTKEARALGETEQRLYALAAWHETPFYTDRERAGLEWAETLTLLASEDVTDEVYQAARQHFSEEELVVLTIAVIAINGWNRLGVGFRTVPGSFHLPGHHEKAA